MRTAVQDRVGKLEQPDQVRDRRTIEAQPAGQLFLGAAVARQVFAKRGRLVDRVQVFALQVFDHRQLEDALIVEHEDPRGHFVELGLDTGPQPALTGDELVAIPDRAHQDRLQHAMLPERVGQRGDILGVELPARLVRVGVDLIDGDLDQLARIKRAAFKAPFFTTEQRFQSAPKTSFIHGR